MCRQGSQALQLQSVRPVYVYARSPEYILYWKNNSLGILPYEVEKKGDEFLRAPSRWFQLLQFLTEDILDQNGLLKRFQLFKVHTLYL